MLQQSMHMANICKDKPPWDILQDPTRSIRWLLNVQVLQTTPSRHWWTLWTHLQVFCCRNSTSHNKISCSSPRTVRTAAGYECCQFRARWSSHAEEKSRSINVYKLFHIVRFVVFWFGFKCYLDCCHVPAQQPNRRNPMPYSRELQQSKLFCPSRQHVNGRWEVKMVIIGLFSTSFWLRIHNILYIHRDILQICMYIIYIYT